MNVALSRTIPAPADVSLEELHELMRAVSETTGRLQETHVELHREVAHLKTELADANAKLRRTEQLAALGEMAAGIAHEIRNPLGSIQLYLQLLREDIDGFDEPVAICRKIERAVAGLETIVRDVLAFARDMRIEIMPLDLSDIFARVNETFVVDIHDTDIVITCEDTTGMTVHADPTLLTQAIGNLVRNAVDAVTESPCEQRLVTLSGRRDRVRCPDGVRCERAVIAVRDTGPGVPPEVVERMFNPFFTTRAAGTGLGLAIVHRIVDAHGGHVNVFNHPQCGAVVELCLPLEPQPRGRAAVTDEE